MNRRAFVAGLGALLAAPRVAEAQQPRTIPRIRILWPYSSSIAAPFAAAFRQGLRDAGYVEGQNIARSTFRPEPPTGLMWGYFAESQTIRTLRMVMYATDRPTCEVSRVKDMKMTPEAAGPSSRCRMSTSCGRCRNRLLGFRVRQSGRNGRRPRLVSEVPRGRGEELPWRSRRVPADGHQDTAVIE